MSLLIVTSMLFWVAAIAGDNPESQWITVSPQSSSDNAAVILPSTAVRPDHSYLLTWDMRVEGEKAWRFRADFAGVTLRFNGTDKTIEKQTSCWQTLDWQRAWVAFDPPTGTQSVIATMAIVSRDALPGRFRLRNVRLIDLSDPLHLNDNEGELLVSVADKRGKDTTARVYIVDESGQGITPPYTFAYTQGTRCFELIDPRLARIALTEGRYTVRATKGFEHKIASKTVEVRRGERQATTLTTEKADWDSGMDAWRSTDHHTHLYRHGGSLYPMMDLHDVLKIARAEGLDYLPFQGVDKALQNGEYRARSFSMDCTQELTRDFWGHMCPIYNQSEILATSPDSAMRSAAPQGSAWPMNMDYISALTKKSGAVAYAHPYGPLRRHEEYAALENPKAGLIAREWPINVALGVPCAIDMLAKEDAHGDFEIKLRDYMRLLNLGFRCAVTGATDFHLDQGREPIGGLRTYARASASGWKEISGAYNSGETYATNGPLVDFALRDCTPGKTLKIGKPGKIAFSVNARSLWGLDRAQIWMNGTLAVELPAKDGAINESGSISIERSGWVLMIAEGPAVADVMSSPEGKPCVAGQYAITSPIYVEVTDSPAPRDLEAAEYFVGWCDAVGRGFDALCAQQSADGVAVPVEEVTKVRERLATARAKFAKMMN